jgi:hypothetical protein
MRCSNHFELLYNLPPLGSRILGLLIVMVKKRLINIEEIVEKMAAQKKLYFHQLESTAKDVK